MSKRGIGGSGWMKIGVVVAVAGLLVAAGQLYYARESVRTQPTMGRGGDGGGGTIIGNNGRIVGGPGGGLGVGGRGGDGGRTVFDLLLQKLPHASSIKRTRVPHSTVLASSDSHRTCGNLVCLPERDQAGSCTRLSPARRLL